MFVQPEHNAVQISVQKTEQINHQATNLHKSDTNLPDE